MTKQQYDIVLRKWGDWLSTLAIVVALGGSFVYLGPWLWFDVLYKEKEKETEIPPLASPPPSDELTISLNIDEKNLMGKNLWDEKFWDSLAEERKQMALLLDEAIFQNINLQSGIVKLARAVNGKSLVPDSVKVERVLPAIDENLLTEFSEGTWLLIESIGLRTEIQETQNIIAVMEAENNGEGKVDGTRLGVEVSREKLADDVEMATAAAVSASQLTATDEANMIEEAGGMKVAEALERGLERGVVRIPDFGRTGDRDLPMILAAHRFGFRWWWENDYARQHSFYYLPDLRPGDLVTIIDGGRRWYYEIYASSEGVKITDEKADLVLYTCKYLNSNQRYFQYARLIDPSLYGIYEGTTAEAGWETVLEMEKN